MHCIDQLRTKEKERQLWLMPKIYEKAIKVIGWLGSYSEDQSKGLQRLHRRYTLFGMDREDPFEEGPNSHALQYVVENAFWGRLWIVQEIFLAQHLQVYTGALR